LIYRGIITIIAVQMRNALRPSTTAAFPIDCFRAYFTIWFWCQTRSACSAWPFVCQKGCKPPCANHLIFFIFHIFYSRGILSSIATICRRLCKSDH